ncbi:hypothetical protein ABPG72_006713 [Tetrahymena utriculariae]
MSKGSQYDENKIMNIQILICGNVAVGKTSIVKQYTEESYSHRYHNTLQSELSKKEEIINQEKVNVYIIDAPGDSRLVDLTKQMIRQAEGYIFVYDIYDKQSFRDIELWITLIKNTKSEFEQCQCILIGNKIDSRRNSSEDITYEQGNQKAKNFNMQFFETSAREGTNIVQAIKKLAISIYHQKKGSIKQQNIINEQQQSKQKDMILLQPQESSNTLIHSSDLHQMTTQPKTKKSLWSKIKSCFGK